MNNDQNAINHIKSSNPMDPIQRLSTIVFMLEEARFCLEYSKTAQGEEKERFFQLGMSVLENMTSLLAEVEGLLNNK